MQFSNNLAHNPVTLAVSLFRRLEAWQGSSSGDPLVTLLEAVAAGRGGGLSPEEETTRLAARDMLRHGKFKPTGRSKPASEYLLGVIDRGDTLPSVLPAVDLANYLSIRWVVPISIWDPDRATSDSFVFRAGLPGESYVFNSAGHAIDLEDLVCGCSASGGSSTPIVNPVKDSMATKLTADSRSAAMAIYIPRSDSSREYAAKALEEANRRFPESGGFELTGSAVLDFGEVADL